MSRKSRSRKLEAVAKAQHLQLPQRERREPVPSTLRPRWVHRLVPVLIALVTFAAFLPTLHNQFVDWDDQKNFIENPHYRGLGWSQLRWMWTTSHMGPWIPLTWMTLGLDYLLWGLNPVGYHVTNLLLHAANAVILYFVALRILSLARPGLVDRGQANLALSAAFAALLFALHPVRVESVAWATERRDVLSGLFYLSAILVYLCACERGERSRGWYWVTVGLFVCALLSKPMAVSLPVVLLVLDVYPLRRLGGSIGWWNAPARQVYLEKIPFALLALAASAIAFLALVQLKNLAPLDELSMLGRLAVSAYGLSFYLWKTVMPVNLSPLYERPLTLNPWAMPFILSYGVVVAITAIVLALRRRVPGLPTAWLAYVVMVLPVLGIFQNGPQIAADRYTYLAGLAWAILAGASLLSCWRATRFLVAAPALGVLLGLGVLTWNQVQVWHDRERLWTHALALDPQSSIAGHNLGIVRADQGKLAEAIEHYRRALQIRPEYASAHNNWGAALAQQGKLAEASEHFRQALRIEPTFANAHYALGMALAHEGKLAEASDHYRQALQIKPGHADAHNNLGNALAQQGKLAEASEHYRQAVHIKPDLANAHYNWGNVLVQQGKLAEASDHYQQALGIKPDYAEAHYNWGNALAQQGNLAEASEHFRQALRIKPDYADAHYNWGNALTQQGKLAEAVEHYRQVLRIKPDHAAARSSLVDALRGLGRGKEDTARSSKGG